MNVELSWESIKKFIQKYMEEKAITIGDDFSVEIPQEDDNGEIKVAEKTENGHFRYISNSRWWLCFLGVVALIVVLICASANVIQIIYREGWWAELHCNWLNFSLFVIGVPILCGIVFGYIGSKSPVYTMIDLEDINRWDVRQKGENVIGVFYDDPTSVTVKSFEPKSDHLATEIATDLSALIGNDKLTLLVCGTTLLNLDGKKYCQYCGQANPEDNLKCQRCGASL